MGFFSSASSSIKQQTTQTGSQRAITDDLLGQLQQLLSGGFRPDLNPQARTANEGEQNIFAQNKQNIQTRGQRSANPRAGRGGGGGPATGREALAQGPPKKQETPAQEALSGPNAVLGKIFKNPQFR